MSQVGQKEIYTQRRLVKFFQEDLNYSYFGNWEERDKNSNIEVSILKDWLNKQGYSSKAIDRAVDKLIKAAVVSGSTKLYDANKEVYSLLRNGIKIKTEVDQKTETIFSIDWENPENNYFAIAEEVTVRSKNTKRPDIVIYINGIAIGVIELKRSKISVAEGIRQNLDNQHKDFIQDFFSTIQLTMAANDSEGLRYGTIDTKEKYYLEWKEEGKELKTLEDSLACLFDKERLIDLLHNFMIFDQGQKKLPRHNQYFGVQRAKEKAAQKEGGLIWHTQGSGKSLTMVWLAKWILENIPKSRVLVMTDRDELDDQIEKVFLGVGENIYRTKSRNDLISKLNSTEENLICSLIHKVGTSEEDDAELFIKDIQSQLPNNFQAKDEIFIFIDEAHRTQSGKLHQAMKAIIPNATLIGFTGTPILKKDKAASTEIFGDYIHTYKYDAAVKDGVVLDLRYEARDIDQTLTSPKKVDQWFDVKTEGMTDKAKAQLKKRWGTMQQIYSADDRLKKIVSDILMDMETKDRLKSGYGNAILVAGSIYEACLFYELFEKTDLKGKCAIVTSYEPTLASIKGEETGHGETEKLHQYKIYRKMLADYLDMPEDKAVHKVNKFEESVKQKFQDDPGQMKLLIVVDKLLTGFDAPSATYLYIDKQMQDHSLFQAICRVNRLHGEDKEYGYIVDYKDLFKSLERSINNYTGEAFSEYDDEDVAGLLKDRLKDGKEKLEASREAIKTLCDPVSNPKTTENYIDFFCPKNQDDTEDNEKRRTSLYKLVNKLIRDYSNIANEMTQAGYSKNEISTIKSEIKHYEDVREEIKVSSGDWVDLKLYEPAMRHLIDTYVRAEDSVKLSAFDDVSLVDLLIEQGAGAVDLLPDGIKKNDGSVAETIDNNVRKAIVKQSSSNPRYYEKMSVLLEELISQRQTDALSYKEYLDQIVELAKDVKDPSNTSAYPDSINSSALQALYDNLNKDEKLALLLDKQIRLTKKDDWRNNRVKEIEVKRAIKECLNGDTFLTDEILELVKNQNDY